MTDQSSVAPVGDPEPAQAVKPAPLPPPVLAKGETHYVVLEEEENGSWTFMASLSAASGAAAIRDALAGDASASGTFVAIPKRSFNPVVVKTETTTRLVIEGEAS